MRQTLLCFLLFFAYTNLFAQYNQFKDDIDRAENARKMMARHKILQVNQYLVNDETTPLTDKVLACRMLYDTKGRLSQTISYLSNFINLPKPDTGGSNYEYDKRGNLVKKNLAEMMEYTTVYEYDDKDRVTSQTYISNLTMMGSNAPMGDIITYEYDKDDNVTEQKDFSLNNILKWKKHYDYVLNNQMKRCTYRTPDSEAETRDEYTYVIRNMLLTKVIRTYKNDALVAEREFVYDKHHNQVKGYETRDGVKNTVWDYTYNDKGQVVRSVGGPATFEGLGFKDLRNDGFSPITYKYDNDGLLIQLSKPDKDRDTGKEITSIEKLVYVKY